MYQILFSRIKFVQITQANHLILSQMCKKCLQLPILHIKLTNYLLNEDQSLNMILYRFVKPR